MREMERRVFKRRLTEVCKENKLQLMIEPRAGSHESWQIHCPETEQTVCFTLTSHRVITKGVQREVVKSAAWFGTKIALGEIVREILERIFENWP